MEAVLGKWEEEMEAVKERAKNKYGVELSESDSNESGIEFKCKFCGKRFKKAQALGGHTSKMHSNKVVKLKGKKKSKRIKKEVEKSLSLIEEMNWSDSK